MLAVDDDSCILDQVEVTLALIGFQVHLSSNGNEALPIAEDFKGIDVLLTDVMMPEMNGMELAGTFKDRHPETPIRFMSEDICPSMGRRDPLEVKRAFLRKPFTTQTLISKIRDVLIHQV